MASADVLAPSGSSSAGLGLTNGDAAPETGHFDVAALRVYLEALLPVLLAADTKVLAQTLFVQSSWHEIADAFANDPSVSTIYVEKLKSDLDQEENGEPRPCR